jgi:hypothetical protein
VINASYDEKMFVPKRNTEACKKGLFIKDEISTFGNCPLQNASFFTEIN